MTRRVCGAIETERKGADKYVVKFVADKLEEAGYTGVKLTLRSDGEEAIVALKRAVAVSRGAETAFVESPVRESKRSQRGPGKPG